MRNYLNKAHEFKIAGYVPAERGLVDQGGFTGMAEGFAQNGFRNFTNFFGPENVDHIDYWSNLNGNDYLWSYGCGAGSNTSAGGLDDGNSLTKAEVAAGYNESTFTMLFGSYFGDWDVSNNLMRAIVANGRTFFNENLGAWGSTNFYASINEEVNFDLSLYPNPSDGFFTIQSDRLIELIEIYSPDGQLVQAITPLNNLQKVDLNQVKAGVYFVRIKANGVWRNKRVVIQ